MNTNPLDQLKRIRGQLLSRVAKLNKSFFTETMICYLSKILRELTIKTN